MAGDFKIWFSGLKKDKNYRYFFSAWYRIKMIGLLHFFRELYTYYKKYAQYPKMLGVKKVDVKYKLYVVYNYFKIVSVHKDIQKEDLLNYVPSKLQHFFIYKLDPKDKRNITFDKILFYRELVEHGLPFPEVFFYLDKGEKYTLSGQKIDVKQTVLPDKLFAKPIRDNGGNDVGIFNRADINKIPDNMLAQSLVCNHPAIQKISDSSAFNTLRIITYLDEKGKVNILSAIYRLSKGKIVDNWGKGSINVEVNIETGSFGETGITKYFEKYTKHPNSDIPFKNFQIPDWDEMISVIIKAAQVFYYLRFIAWDIGLTKDGPVIVEANSGCDLFHAQLFKPYENTILFDDLKGINNSTSK